MKQSELQGKGNSGARRPINGQPSAASPRTAYPFVVQGGL